MSGEPASNKKYAKAKAADSWLLQAFPASPEPQPEEPKSEPEPEPRALEPESEPEPELAQRPSASGGVLTAVAMDHVTADGPASAAAPSLTIDEWLTQVRLSVFVDCLARLGYKGDLGYTSDLVEVDSEELEDIMRAVEGVEGVMKPAVKKFKREIAKLRGRGESFSCCLLYTSDAADE